MSQEWLPALMCRRHWWKSWGQSFALNRLEVAVNIEVFLLWMRYKRHSLHQLMSANDFLPRHLKTGENAPSRQVILIGLSSRVSLWNPYWQMKTNEPVYFVSLFEWCSMVSSFSNWACSIWGSCLQEETAWRICRSAGEIDRVDDGNDSVGRYRGGRSASKSVVLLLSSDVVTGIEEVSTRLVSVVSSPGENQRDWWDDLESLDRLLLGWHIVRFNVSVDHVPLLEHTVKLDWLNANSERQLKNSIAPTW